MKTFLCVNGETATPPMQAKLDKEIDAATVRQAFLDSGEGDMGGCSVTVAFLADSDAKCIAEVLSVEINGNDSDVYNFCAAMGDRVRAKSKHFIELVLPATDEGTD